MLNFLLEFTSGVKQTGITNISDMQLTWSGSALVAIDSLSQMYLYRLSPINDQGMFIKLLYVG